MASHVLHRFLVPRHPPCALKNLATDARVHCVVLKQRPATHHTPPRRCFTGAGILEGMTLRPYPQTPNNVPSTVRSSNPVFHAEAVLAEAHALCRIVNVPPMSNRASHSLAVGYVLLRKEVIQPHLPVRLPCYDFVPIANPTFDGSLPRVGSPASGVTDFRDVTGGVYKARERIHRSMLICDY